MLTYRRPDDLDATLPLLVAQAGLVADDDIDVRVLVIDNDPDAGARLQVEAVARRQRIVTYVHEPAPGIAAARNRALAESESDDLLVFIDDDERPTDRWLTLLLAARTRYGAQAVVGPVISEFSVPLTPWVEAGRFFDRRRMPTGTPIDVAATNNLLLDLVAVRAAGLTFDLASGLTGGEDTLFTREFHRSGALMVWCDEAIVTDVVPADRTTRSWVLQRALSSGNSWSVTELRLATGSRLITRAKLTAKAGVRIVGGAASEFVGVATGSLTRRARGRRTVSRGVGMLLGAWGHEHVEYQRATK